VFDRPQQPFRRDFEGDDAAGRYLFTSGRRQDAGRTITVEECDDSGCFESGYASLLEP
jgi:hypothetical protein